MNIKNISNAYINIYARAQTRTNVYISRTNFNGRFSMINPFGEACIRADTGTTAVSDDGNVKAAVREPQ